MKIKLTNLALVFGAACTFTSCSETKEAVAGAADKAKDAASSAVDSTKEMASDAVESTKEMASGMADKVIGADSQEKLVDDAIKLMEEGMESMELMISGDEAAAKAAAATMQEKGKALEERAKALGLDMSDPSSLPDELKAKVDAASKKLQEKTQAMMAEQMKKAMEGAAGQ